MNRRRRILVVDDSIDVREMYQLVLSSAGYDVALADDGVAGFEAIRRTRPDVVILDVVMPVMDGLELLLKLRSDLTPPVPPVILCSGFDLTEEEALRRGAVSFLRKPVETSDLLDTVRDALEQRTPATEMVQRQRQHATMARRRVLDSARDLVARMEAHGSDALDALEERAQDRIATLADYLGIARGVVALVHDERLIVLASTAETALRRGVDFGRAVPEAYEVLETGSSLMLPDASAHPFEAVSRALGGIRFFAGVPMLVDERVPLGVVCLFDPACRRIDSADLAALEVMGRRGTQVMQAFAISGDAGRAIRYARGIVEAGDFTDLLACELRLLDREGGSMELAVTDVRDVDLVSEAIANSDARERLVATVLGGGRRVALFKRARDDRARAALAKVLADMRDGDGNATGDVGIVDLVELGARALDARTIVALASNALDRAASTHGGTRRIVIDERRE